jgi:hypothetical protein
MSCHPDIFILLLTRQISVARLSQNYLTPDLVL